MMCFALCCVYSVNFLLILPQKFRRNLFCFCFILNTVWKSPFLDYGISKQELVAKMRKHYTLLTKSKLSFYPRKGFLIWKSFTHYTVYPFAVYNNPMILSLYSITTISEHFHPLVLPALTQVLGTPDLHVSVGFPVLDDSCQWNHVTWSLGNFSLEHNVFKVEFIHIVFELYSFLKLIFF